MRSHVCSRFAATILAVGLFILGDSAAVAQRAPQASITVVPQSIVADSVDARDVEISRFGTYIAVYDTSEGNSVRLFDADLNQLWRHRLRLYWAGSLQQGSILQFAPDESFVVFPSFRTDSDVCVCDTATGEPIDVLRAHESSVEALALSRDGQSLVTASHDEVILWRRTDRRFAVADTLPDFAPSVRSIEFLPDGRLVVSTTRDSTLRSVVLYDTRDGRLAEVARHDFRDNNISYDIDQLAVSPDGSWIAAGYADTILLFSPEADSLRLRQEIRDIDLGNHKGLEFAPDGRALASGHFGYLRWWLLDDSGAKAYWTEGPTSATQQPVAQDLALSADGRHLLVASRADENALTRFAVTGVGGSNLGLIVDALGGAVSTAQRAVLTDRLAGEIMTSLGTGALADRDMFETQTEYENRIAAARETIRSRIGLEIESAYGAVREANDAALYDAVLPLEDQGAYDIDRRLYHLRVFGDTASLSLDRDTARSLFGNWTDARVRATRYETDGATGYADFRLVHPTDRIEYPIVLERNPFSGERMDAAVNVVPAVAAGPDLMIRDLRIDAVFPTLYQRYATDPFGTLRIENVGTGIVSGLTVVFSIGGITNGEQAIRTPDSLASGQVVEAQLIAPMSTDLLAEAEGRTATLAIDVSYRRLGESRGATITRQIRILNRNAIQWDDDRRIGAFMSVSQPELLAWVGRIAGSVETEPTPVLSRYFLSAMQLFESLRLAGIEYVVDPNSAYERLSADERAVDYLRFPMETVAHGAGDCDDLSVLYATMLESVGVPTAFITTPGHIFVAVDSGIEPGAIDRAFSSAENLIVREGRTWLPVETTALGEGFVRAWQIGGLQWRQASSEGTAGFFTAQDAWERYAPVGAPAGSPGSSGAASRPDTTSTRLATGDQLALFRDLELEPKLKALRAQANDPRAPQTQNRLGVLYATYGLFEEAAASFRAAIGDGDYVPAMINLANVLSIGGHHGEAQSLLARARELEPENARVLMGLAFSLWESGDRDEARDTWEVASRVSPTLARRYPLFGGADDGDGTRAGVGVPLFTNDWADE